MVSDILNYLLIILGIIILYEIIRGLVVAKIREKLYRSVTEYIDQYKVRLDRFKLIHKLVVKQELLNNSEIHQAIIEHAEEKGIRIPQVQKQVEDYIEEIVPFFNLLSYYKIGYRIAHGLLNLVYEVVIDHENAEKLEKIPPDSVVVFVMNHRSNIDYILVAYMLAQQISLSYAVGEWARVWPLEYIFKSFGAYFIRRRYREKLYHLVLEKYVQLISLQGVTQGIFLEGGLSRDGRFRPAKVGILDYIIGIKKNPSFKKELVFVPAAINYDWVLEDRNLLTEWKKGKEKSGFRDNISSLVRVVVGGPVIITLNILRYFSGKLKHHGYASVSFGDPVSFSHLLKKHKTDFFSLERPKRLARVQTFADKLLQKIGEVVPVTPISLVSAALLSFDSSFVSRDDLIRRVRYMRIGLKKKDCRIVIGRAFESSRESSRRLADEKETRQKDLVKFEERLLEHEEAIRTVDVALELLKKRRAISMRKMGIVLSQKRKHLIEFYANSIRHLLDEKDYR